MAYVSKEDKQIIQTRVKDLFKKRGFKGRVGGQGSSTLKITITEGPLRLPTGPGYEPKDKYGEERFQVNPYRFNDSDALSPEWKDFLNELDVAIKKDIWFDKSDSMIDYFHTAFYISITIGTRDKSYKEVA